MKLGVQVATWGSWVTPDTIALQASRAEAAGFDSLWVADHVVIPRTIDSPYPFQATGPFSPEMRQIFEPIAALSFLAGRTSRIQLGTSVLVAPQRQPLLLAKQWATLDALSGGRTILGLGSGWLREEFEALGAATFQRRGRATDEIIQICRAAWSAKEEVSFEGEVFRFQPVAVRPKPARPGGPPIWVGGHGRPSIRRAAWFGDAWYPFRMPRDELARGVATLRELAAEASRQPGEPSISMVFLAYAPGARPAGVPRDFELAGSSEEIAAGLRRYAALGLEHAVLVPQPRDSVAPSLEVYEMIAQEVRPLVSQ